MNNRKVFIIIILLLGGCANVFCYAQPKAVEGLLDLTRWRSEEGVIHLDGEWEFYWKQLLSPSEFKKTKYRPSRYIDIPSTWNGVKVNAQKLPGDGYATLRLILKTEESSRLAMKIPRILTSYQLWVNGKLLASAGQVGQSRSKMIPQYLPQVALFETRQGENEIIIQVSNYYHRSGGILESIILGSEKQILDLRYKSIAYEIFLFGCLMIMGIYHLALFFFRKKDPSPLYFGLFCLFVGIRTTVVGERFFIYLFPAANWEVVHKVQTLTFYLGVPVILIFFKSVFPQDFAQGMVRIVKVVGLAFGGLVLLTPAKIFTVFNPVYQLFTIFVCIYITFVLLKLLYQKKMGSGFIFAGTLALILTSINDIIFLSIWMNDHSSSILRTICRTGNLSSLGQLIFVFAQSLVLAQKFSYAFEKEEVVTAKLREMNLNLDKLVIKRTEALEKSRQKIEEQKAELEKNNQFLELLSLKDPLTNLWNRRQFDETMQHEWERGLKYKRPLALMILDIDRFKEYNDYYGHKAGDECLIRVAQALTDSLCEDDLLARYGGEEFVVIMRELGKDDATEKALFLQKTIEDLKIPHQRSSVSNYITVSIGVTSMIPDLYSSPKDLFLAADRALYQAKAAGRNQVRFL